MGNKQTQFSFMMILMLVVFMPMSLAFTGSGAGTVGDPYIITTANEFNETHLEKGAYYELGNDLDMSGLYSDWTPIGDWSASGYFTGAFDGKDYTISNFHWSYYDPTYEFPIGVFGAVLDPIYIKNVHFTNFSMTSLNSQYETENCGALVPADDSAGVWDMTNVHVEGIVDCRNIGGQNGGLVGRVDANLINVSFTGDVYAGGNIGGIGDEFDSLYQASFTGRIFHNQSTDWGAGQSVGGLGGGTSNYIINQSYANAQISYTGYADRICTTCRYSGVVGTTSGGASSITDTYVNATLPDSSVADISSDIVTTGLVQPICTDVYVNDELGNVLTTTGCYDNFGDPLGIVELTNAQMVLQASYSSFDFTNIWSIEEGVSSPTHIGVGVIACASDFVCTGYGAPVCLVNDTTQASCNAVVDNNACGIPYAGNFSEFPPEIDSCVYISEATNDAQDLVFALLPLILIIGLLFSMPSVRQGAISKLESSGTARIVVGVFALIITVTLLSLL